MPVAAAAAAGRGGSGGGAEGRGSLRVAAGAGAWPSPGAARSPRTPLASPRVGYSRRGWGCVVAAHPRQQRCPGRAPAAVTAGAAAAVAAAADTRSSCWRAAGPPGETRSLRGGGGGGGKVGQDFHGVETQKRQPTKGKDSLDSRVPSSPGPLQPLGRYN